MTQVVRGFSLNGVDFVGAVQRGEAVVGWPKTGQTTDTVTAALADQLLALEGTRRTPRVILSGRVAEAVENQRHRFAGKNVLVAMRNGERAEAVRDWLNFHAAEHGAEAALVFDRSGPESGFAEALTDMPEVLVVRSDQPLGHANGADMRDPQAAPAARKRGVVQPNSWHAPLQEHGIYDLLREMFLQDARAVAFLDVADLLLPISADRTVFDLAADIRGRVLSLHGLETYPWRLRQNRPAPHSDHISARRSERRRVVSWAIAPGDHLEEGVWRPLQPHGLPIDDAPPLPFVRAMGVVYPGAPVKRLVRKSDLTEDSRLVELMMRVVGADPLRLPAPSTIPPRPADQSVAIVTAMKNEGPFILDWVAHHRAIGVDNLLVYTNDCEDGSDHLLSLLASAGVTHRENPFRLTRQVPQYAAFRAAESEAVVQNADWLLTLDVDEYLNIHAGAGTLKDLFAALPQAHVISVPWRMFGNSDRHDFQDVPMAEQFTLCAPEYAPRPLQAWAFKTLYRNEGIFRRLGVHRPKGLSREFRETLVWLDANGTPLPPVIWDKAWRMSKAQWGYTHATINHYAVRSAENFLVKRERGKVNRTKREQGLAYWFRMNHNAAEDRSILRMKQRVEAEKTALLSLPGVAEAHARAVDWHRRRIATLKTDPDYAGLFAKITSPRMEHLSRIATNFGANVHLVGPDVIPDEFAAHDPSKPFYWTVKLSR